MDKNIKKLLHKWVKLDEEIKNLEIKLKLLKLKKKKINPILEDYMNKYNLKKINLNKSHYLNILEKDYYKPINKNYISKTLSEMIDNNDKKDKIINYLYNNRDIVTFNILEIKKNI